MEQRKPYVDKRNEPTRTPHREEYAFFNKHIKEMIAGIIILVIIVILAFVLLCETDATVKGEIIGIYKAIAMIIVGVICGANLKE